MQVLNANILRPILQIIHPCLPYYVNIITNSISLSSTLFPPSCSPDWVFGEQPEEVLVNYCEAKDKFIVDWYPETCPELEAMAQAEEMRMDKDPTIAPVPWLISEPLGVKSVPRVVFERRS